MLGPNGAGKTTLVGILSSQILATSGTAHVCGLDCATQPKAVRAVVGVAPSNQRSVYWRLTGRENLLRFAALHHVKRSTARSRANALLSQFGLADAQHQRVGQYSAGMRARLILARAMLHDPPVLLLDEPWAPLDPEGRLDLIALLQRVSSQERKTIILCSHDLALVERICDRVAILSRGELLAEGTPDELLEDCANQYVLELQFRTSDAAGAAAACVGGLGQVEIADKLIRLVVPDSSATVAKLASLELMRDADLTIRRTSLEDAYMSLVAKQNGSSNDLTE